MSQLQLLLLLLRPSLLSFVLSAVLTPLILGAANWSYITQSPFLYEYFFGPQGFITASQTSANLADSISLVFASPITYNIFVAIVAVLVGLIVYIGLESLSIAALGIADTWDIIHVNNREARLSMVREMSIRRSFRTVVVIVWCLYWLFFINILLPFCILSTKITTNEAITPEGASSIALGSLALFIGFHLHVIFMRLITLRPRVFGSTAAVLAEDR